MPAIQGTPEQNTLFQFAQTMRNMATLMRTTGDAVTARRFQDAYNGAETALSEARRSDSPITQMKIRRALRAQRHMLQEAQRQAEALNKPQIAAFVTAVDQRVEITLAGQGARVDVRRDQIDVSREAAPPPRAKSMTTRLAAAEMLRGQY